MNLNITSNIPVNCTNASREKASFRRSADEARRHARVSAGAVEYPSIQKTVMKNRWTLQLHRLSDHKRRAIASDCDNQPGTSVLLSGQPTEYLKRGESGSVRLQGFAHTVPSAWAPSVNATN